MEKSADAFRTISEVADQLETPAHVLRFWESRFPQIRPVKRAGGRRYYRPSDVALLAGIKRLLHDEGVTIRGVQKILREQGVRHVAALSGIAPLPQPEPDIEAVLAREFGPLSAPEAAPDAPADTPADAADVQTAQVISLEAALARVEQRAEHRAEQRADQRAVQLPLDLQPDAAEAPEAPFVEAEEEPLPEPVPLFAPQSGDAVPEVPQDVIPDGPQDGGIDAGDDSDQAVETLGESSVMMRLRMADPATTAPRRAELLALRERMVDLRARLAKGVRRRSR